MKPLWSLSSNTLSLSNTAGLQTDPMKVELLFSYRTGQLFKQPPQASLFVGLLLWRAGHGRLVGADNTASVRADRTGRLTEQVTDYRVPCDLLTSGRSASTLLPISLWNRTTRWYLRVYYKKFSLGFKLYWRFVCCLSFVPPCPNSTHSWRLTELRLSSRRRSWWGSRPHDGAGRWWGPAGISQEAVWSALRPPACWCRSCCELWTRGSGRSLSPAGPRRLGPERTEAERTGDSFSPFCLD